MKLKGIIILLIVIKFIMNKITIFVNKFQNTNKIIACIYHALFFCLEFIKMSNNSLFRIISFILTFLTSGFTNSNLFSIAFLFPIG